MRHISCIPQVVALVPKTPFNAYSLAWLQGTAEDMDEEESEPVANCGVILSWCGDPKAVLEVWVDGRMCVPSWNQQSQGDSRVPMRAGQHECCVRTANGAIVWDGAVAAVEGEWIRLDVGVLFEKVASDPQNRSQFSFPDGRSACSFLICDAAALLSENLGGGDNELEIQGAEVSREHVAEVLTRGMARYLDGPQESFAAMGLEHTSVLEVLEFGGWVWNGEWGVAPDGTFWGSLAEDSAMYDCLSQVARSAKAAARSQCEGAAIGGKKIAGRVNSQPIFAALTRPPETVLVVLGSTGAENDNLLGVLDTHTRFVGSKQYPASFYQCKSLGQLADLLRFTFFPLPEGLHPEELGTYVLFELNLLSRKRPADGDGATSAVHSYGRPPDDLEALAERVDVTDREHAVADMDDDELDPDVVDLSVPRPVASHVNAVTASCALPESGGGTEGVTDRQATRPG